MPTRNIVLWIIVLTILFSVAFGFFYFQTPGSDNPNEGETNFVATLWPFGKSNDVDAPAEDGVVDISGYESPNEEEVLVSRLKKVSSMPVAGYGVFLKERYGETEVELAPYVRYADKATANVYQTFADNIDERKFSTTTVPYLYEAFFGNKGGAMILRYLSEDNRSIQTYAGILPEEILGGDASVSNELSGSYLPENISGLSVSPDFLKIFYLLRSGDGMVGITAQTSGEGKSQVFSSPFTEWLPAWPNDRMITITTKPSALVPGFMYAIDPISKDLSKLLGGINGLTTLTSPSGKLILYANNNLSLNILNRDTGQITQVGVRTLPEKCAWSSGSDTLYCAVPKFVNGSNYPDTWYQGELYFSDEIWKIDSFNGNGLLLADPFSFEGGEDIDAINVSLDPTEKYLFFMNKKDSYLWMLEL